MRLVTRRSPARPPEPRPKLRTSGSSEAPSLWWQTRRASARLPERPTCCMRSIFSRTQNLKKLHYSMTLHIFCIDPHVTLNISHCLVVILRYLMSSRQSKNYCLGNKQMRPQTCSWLCALLCWVALLSRAQCSFSCVTTLCQSAISIYDLWVVISTFLKTTVEFAEEMAE